MLSRNALSVVKTSSLFQTALQTFDKERRGYVFKLRPHLQSELRAKGTIAILRVQSRRYRTAETPIRAPMTSERRPSWSGDRSKDSVPASPSWDDEFPTLSAAAEVKSSRKGKGRGPAEQGYTFLPSKPQEVSPKTLGFPDETEKQSVKVDSGHQSGDRQGVQLGNGVEAANRRDESQNSQARDSEKGRAEIIGTLGRTLTKILRHQAAELNLEMSSDGYVSAEKILSLSMKTRSHRALSSHTIDDVKQAVQQDNKQRLGIKEEDGQLFIRANQGHTMEGVKSEQLLKPVVSADEVPVCVHGTYKRHLDQIFKEGLKRMQRNHIHFAPGLVGNDGVVSGMRTSSQVLIYLNVEKALADGMKLYMSENKVILTEGFDGVVPSKYFKEVLGLPDMKPLARPKGPA